MPSVPVDANAAFRAGQQAAASGRLDEAKRHFLAGYADGAKDLASVPREAASFDAALGLFLVEKALYELRYEIANRPEWIEIPLRGLIELATT